MPALDAWVHALSESGVGADEIGRRRAVVEEFCVFAEAEPDDLVERCLNRERGQIIVKERKKVEALISEFGEQTENGDSRAVTERANFVRSFFIHNGVRLIAPRAPWL